MALRKITFDGSEVTSKDDADINYHLYSLIPAGIIAGLYNEVSVSAGNNFITFGSGVVQIYGRRIMVEANTQVSVTLDSSKYGYIVIQVNVSSNSVQLSKLESASGYPSLTQNNLHNTNGIYQFPLCRYTKTATSLTIDNSYTNSRPKIKTLTQLVDEKYTSFQNYVDNKYSKILWTPVSQSSGIYKYNIDGRSLSDYIFAVRLKTYGVVVFPGSAVTSASIQSLSYNYLGTTYQLTIEYTGQQMYLYSSNRSHPISNVQGWR
jgi:hypothetical protein